MFLPEYEIGQISKFATPYQYRLDKEKYPLKEIFLAADLAGHRGEEIAAQQVKLLHSPNKIVRYWEGIGLRYQSLEDLKPYHSELLKAQEDEYPPVMITIAAIVYDLWENKTAEDLLKKYAQDKNKALSLMAINYLLYV